MNEQQKETLLSLLCLLSGIGCYLLVILWYIGLVLALIAVALAVWHDRKYPANRVVTVGLWLGLVYIGLLILIALFIWGYFHMLHIGL